jgi:hypothetical protein
LIEPAKNKGRYAIRQLIEEERKEVSRGHSIPVKKKKKKTEEGLNSITEAETFDE